MAETVQIGKAARLAGVSVDTVRFYQKLGLIRSAGRTPGGYRLFDGEEIRDLTFVRHAQELGFSLIEVKELLALRQKHHACSQVQHAQAQAGNFRRMFGGPGANYAFLGDAGNFAYGAVSGNIGVPRWTTEAVAGAYSVRAHPISDWGGPWLMDPSARVQVPAGYSAACTNP